MVFKGKKSTKEIKYWLEDFQKKVNREAVNQHLQFTAEIWTTESKPPLTAKEDKVKMAKNEKLPFLDIKTSWYPEGNLQFGVFRKKGQQLKYVKKQFTHTPGTLPTIPSEVLKRLAKLTSRTPSLHSEGVEICFPDHTNALCKAGLSPPNLPTMGDLWKMQDRKLDIKNEK